MFKKCPYCYDSYSTDVGCGCLRGRQHFTAFCDLTKRLDAVSEIRVNHKIPDTFKKSWYRILQEVTNVK